MDNSLEIFFTCSCWIKRIVSWAVVVVKWSGVLAFDSDNPSSNPADAYLQFFLQNLSTKINKKRPGLAHFLNYNCFFLKGILSHFSQQRSKFLIIQSPAFR